MKRTLILAAALLCCTQVQAAKALEITVSGRITGIGQDYVEVEGQRWTMERGSRIAQRITQLGSGAQVTLQVTRAGSNSMVKSAEPVHAPSR
jgi:hypothetical protein